MHRTSNGLSHSPPAGKCEDRGPGTEKREPRRRRGNGVERRAIPTARVPRRSPSPRTVPA
eukprot:6164313-Prymnesium_polylepis.1